MYDMNSPEFHKLMDMASLFSRSFDDPEDTIFVSLTNRDTMAIGLACAFMRASAAFTNLNSLSEEGWGQIDPALDSLLTKIADCIQVQKAADLNGENNET